jgi:hypothetical protein
MQLEQISFLSRMQLDPVAALPFVQVHMFALHVLSFKVQPVLQLVHIAVWLTLHVDPLAAFPFEQ